MKRLILTTVLLATSSALWAQQVPEYSTVKLSDTVYMLKGSGGNVGISAGEDGVFIIDDQFAPIAEHLVEQIRNISNKDIRFVINTHFHGDHTGGNEVLGDMGAVIVAHDNIRVRMGKDQFSAFWGRTVEATAEGAWPVVTFSENVTLHLNGESATVYHTPEAHTDGDGIIHFPESNVIHMGDIYFNGLYPFIDLDSGGTVQGMIAAVNKGLELANDDTQIIPGHGPMATKEDMTNYRDFLVKAMNNVKVLVDEGKSLDQAIAAKPNAEWDDTIGQVWITPAQFVTFIYNSLKGIREFTPSESS